MNIVRKNRLLVRLIILIISISGLILFYFLKGNGNLYKWISQNLEFALVYLLFFIGINMPVYKIFFGLYWRYSNRGGKIIFNKQYFTISIFIFIAAAILFICSIFIAESMAIASVLILIAQYNLSERVIFRSGDDIYYTNDISFTEKKIKNIDFLKNSKRVIVALNISAEVNNKAVSFNIPVLPEEVEKMEKILL
ncbi:MAG: hypothetical protein FWD71_13085 [Oscillospiraceae bacterium]|nr:hypothetical protein [Oscillospiraceae bacterium]